MQNILREKIRTGQPMLATRLWSTDPIITEVVGESGLYHYIEFSAEYSAFTQRDLENIVRAAELHGMGSMIKVDLQNRQYVTQKAVGAGFQAVLFADHRTADEVRESIRCIRAMAPGADGLFGFPTRRFIGMSYRANQQQHIQRLNDIVVCLMIEKKETMENLEEILSVPGVDMVQFGPSDYSLSMGWNRSEKAEELFETEKRMIEAAIRHGVRPRCEINTAADAEKYKALGLKDFSLGDEVRILETFWKSEGKKMAAALSSLTNSL